MSTDLRPVLFMLISTFSLSFNGLMGKLLTESFSTEVLGFLRFFLPASIMLLMLKSSGWVIPNKHNSRPIIIRALCVVGSQLCFLAALNELTLVESVVLFSTGPLFIPVLEKLMYRTPIQGITLACLAMTFCGVLLQAGNPAGMELKPELLIGLAAGGFNALSQVTLFKGAKSDLPPAALNGWCFMLAAIILLPVATMRVVTNDSLLIASNPFDTNMLLVLLITLAISIVSTQMFRAKAYKLVSTGSQLAPLIFTNLLFALIWQVSFFNETLESNKVVGISLIVLATIINTFGPKWIQHQRAAAH
ncbi:DMT family transporter [Photobacterium rosenbergii]|uniref:DMT family transporter n=1 Tax=Photobacterium rosenbergii TaxID=294936 RepID=UPI001C98F41A|nr:DMT family transporter [Photobacterium rosenbergii]MBY5944382.1 DMT family transporter [Photobacterium rosenbergii]